MIPIADPPVLGLLARSNGANIGPRCMFWARSAGAVAGDWRCAYIGIRLMLQLVSALHSALSSSGLHQTRLPSAALTITAAHLSKRRLAASSVHSAGECRGHYLVLQWSPWQSPLASAIFAVMGVSFACSGW